MELNQSLNKMSRVCKLAEIRNKQRIGKLCVSSSVLSPPLCFPLSSRLRYETDRQTHTSTHMQNLYDHQCHAAVFACLACDFKLITTRLASDSGDQCLSWRVFECGFQVIERGGSLLVGCHRRTAQSHVSAPACQLSIICSDRSGYNQKWH